DLNNKTNIAQLVDEDITSALFVTLKQLPFTTLLSILSIIIVATFLITSADSATYILASKTTKESLFPPLIIKVLWDALMGAIAGVLLYAGGLEALKTASLVSALPFTVLIIILMYTIVKILKNEPITVRPVDVRQYEDVKKEAQKLSDND